MNLACNKFLKRNARGFLPKLPFRKRRLGFQLCSHVAVDNPGNPIGDLVDYVSVGLVDPTLSTANRSSGRFIVLAVNVPAVALVAQFLFLLWREFSHIEILANSLCRNRAPSVAALRRRRPEPRTPLYGVNHGKRGQPRATCCQPRFTG